MPETTRRRAVSDAPLAQPAEPTSMQPPDAAAVELGARVASFAALLDRPVEAQHASGYYHTLREICQQPGTWRRTAAAMVQRRDILVGFLQDASAQGPAGAILVTGSGSSFYGAECLSWCLHGALPRPVVAVPAGQLLTDGVRHLPVERPSLMISLGRSGNSPESSAAIDLLLETEPECRHLIITCNQEGRLAQRYQRDPRALAVVLDDATCDRSLVMTSSLTNMLAAGRFLGSLDAPDSYISRIEGLAAAATQLLLQHADALARIARDGFRSAVFLGSGSMYGAAREAALKMLEMTAGQMPTMAETYLSLRHGPMSAVHDGTVLLCFLSSDPVTRAYEMDVIREMDQKDLGLLKVIVGRGLATDCARTPAVVINVSDEHALRDDDLPLLEMLAGQLMAFFSSLHVGCEPDRPSRNGAIARVVASFDIHRRTQT
ncbi:MAG: SIS domain-containing protein [Luteitalea sp.]|nr:SIS domain-containing protein [Luteitalea sp.]